MLQFYMTPGSCATGLHILLEEADLIFGVNLVNLPKGEHQTEAFLSMNPKGTIPVLVTPEGTVFGEFVGGATWVALNHPKAKLLPEDPAQAAQALEMASYVSGTIHGQAFHRIFRPEAYLLDGQEDTAPIEALGREKVDASFKAASVYLERASDDGLMFDHLTIADAALFYVTFWANRLEIDLPPRLASHYAAMTARPKVKMVLAEEGYRL